MALKKLFQIVGRYQRPRTNFECRKFAVSYSLVEKAATESSCFAGIFNAVAELIGSLHVTKSFTVVRLDCRVSRWMMEQCQFVVKTAI
jgi:hypothetical protein